MKKVVISADSTCDIGQELKQKYDIKLVNNHITLDGKEYIDTVDITPEDIYKAWREKKVLPRTSAITPADYYEHFQSIRDDGQDIVHLSLGSGLSSSFQNSVMLANDMEGIYPVDSSNLSSGFGLLVIKAAEMAEMGMSGAEIQQAVNNMHSQSHGSFLLDTLEFMKAGGRCSSLTALGANILKIKPCIQVDTADEGRLKLGKKYRGTMEEAIDKYIHATLKGKEDLDLDRVFVTHSGCPQPDIERAIDNIRECCDFKEIHVAKANSTISSHCGPRTIGVMFMTK